MVTKTAQLRGIVRIKEKTLTSFILYVTISAQGFPEISTQDTL